MNDNELKVMRETDIEAILRAEFPRYTALSGSVLSALTKICRRNRLIIVQAPIASYGGMASADTLTVDG